METKLRQADIPRVEKGGEQGLGFGKDDEKREEGEVRSAVREQRCESSGSQIVVPWSTLPTELLQNIIARLPLPLLINLRQFALNPNCNINLDEREFTHLCARIHSNMVGLIVPIKGSGSRDRRIQGFYSVGVHDMKSSTWQIIEISVAREYDLLDSTFDKPLTSCNGGLVSFAQTVFTKSDGMYHVVIVVVNPLTGHCKELPEPSIFRLKMMQLVMDRDAKCYKVILVGLTSCRDDSFVVKCYDSRTGVWTVMEESPDVVFGLQYSKRFIGIWGDRGYDATSYGTYDCARGALVEFGNIEGWACGGHRGGQRRGPYVFVEDCSFRFEIHEDLGIYNIAEYRMVGSRWVKLKHHPFDPYSSDRRPDRVYDVKFWGCKGFLLVVENVIFKHDRQPQEVAWLFDLSTGAWSDFPELRDGRNNLSSTSSVLCELQWDSVP